MQMGKIFVNIITLVTDIFKDHIVSRCLSMHVSMHEMKRHMQRVKQYGILISLCNMRIDMCETVLQLSHNCYYLPQAYKGNGMSESKHLDPLKLVQLGFCI